jgi:chitinase
MLKNFKDYYEKNVNEDSPISYVVGSYGVDGIDVFLDKLINAVKIAKNNIPKINKLLVDTFSDKKINIEVSMKSEVQSEYLVAIFYISLADYHGKIIEISEKKIQKIKKEITTNFNPSRVTISQGNNIVTVGW